MHQLSLRPGFSSSNIAYSKAAFAFGDHWCIVLELLHGTLLDLVKTVRPCTLPMEHMRKLTFQLLVALSFLASEGVIHADVSAALCCVRAALCQALTHHASNFQVRPENVLSRTARDPNRRSDQPVFRVKLADLGNSFRVAG